VKATNKVSDKMQKITLGFFGRYRFTSFLWSRYWLFWKLDKESNKGKLESK